uniref:Uncharacterized protein n=1 Tax=Solanum tuberosum TaxID=4113 RepID=M1AU99_SOLTU
MVEDHSPFKQIKRKLQMKKGLVSKSEAIALFMEEVKKDLMKNLNIDIKYDISMASASHTNEEDDATCPVGEGQNIDSNEEIDLDALFQKFQQQVEESSSISTAVKKTPEGKLHGQKILDAINNKIVRYLDIATSEPQMVEDHSPFKQITRKLQMKKGLISKSEAIALYKEEVKKDLMKNLDIDIKDDISMASASHTNEEDDATCPTVEGQDIDSNKEIYLDALFQKFQQ